MLIIDAQVHAYERNHPGRPWVGVPTGPDEVTGDAMVAAMEAVGVAGAVLVSPFSLYGYDASYALEVSRQHPGRFGLVKPVNPTDPAAAETIADWAATPGTIPTVCLDVIALVASSCRYNRGEIEPRVAHEFTAHVATQRGRAERPPHRHPPRAQPVAPLRECHGRRPRLPPRSCTAQAPHREQGHPGSRTWEEKRPHRLTMPREAMPARLSSFRLPAMASPPLDARRELLI